MQTLNSSNTILERAVINSDLGPKALSNHRLELTHCRYEGALEIMDLNSSLHRWGTGWPQVLLGVLVLGSVRPGWACAQLLQHQHATSSSIPQSLHFLHHKGGHEAEPEPPSHFLTYKKIERSLFSLHSCKSTFSDINHGLGTLVHPLESKITYWHMLWFVFTETKNPPPGRKQSLTTVT